MKNPKELAQRVINAYNQDPATFIDKIFTKNIGLDIDLYIMDKHNEENNVVSHLDDLDYTLDFFVDLMNNPEDYTNQEIKTEVDKLKTLI